MTATVATALLAACGGGGTNAVSSNPSVSATSISGAVVKGPVNGAQVCGYAVSGNAQGALLGSCVTSDASGNYTIVLPVGSGPLWIQATGGTYTDEATGVLASLPVGSPLATLITATGGSVSAMLTPLTTLALNAATASAGSGGTLDTAAFSTAATQLLNTFNLPAGLNINSTLPSFGASINSYGTALTAISQMVANGTSLATILSNSNPSALAAAYGTAAAQTPNGGGGSGGVGLPSATGSVTVSGLTDFTPQATGFEVSMSSSVNRASYRFFVETQRAIGTGFTTDKREVKIEPLSGGGYSVTLYNSATREFNLCFSNCAVSLSTPNGTNHPVQVTFNGLALTGNRTVNGSLTGDAPGAAWTPADLPGASTSNLTLNANPVSVMTSADSVTDLGNGSTVRIISLRLSDGSFLTLQKTGDAPFTAGRSMPPATLSSCAANCGITLVDSEGTQLTFANTPLSGGMVLNGTVSYARTSGSLTSSDLGGFTPIASSIEALNGTRTLTFNVLGTAAQAGLSLVTVEIAGGSVIRVQATVGIATQLLGCLANGAGIGIPPCAGVSIGTDGRTVTFNNATLRGGAIGSPARNVTFNGAVVAKGP